MTGARGGTPRPGSCWTGTWATATERSGDADMPKATLSNHAVRQTVHVSLGGSILRLQLSNTFCQEPVDIKSVYIADAVEGSDIAAATARYLTFSGRKAVTIEGGKTVVSDGVKYQLRPLQRLSITINYGARTPKNATGHRGSRTTTYIMQGESKPKAAFPVAEAVERWYNIDAIDVQATATIPDGLPPGCIAVLGNSITDGRGSTTDAQNRWTDILAEQLEGKVGVLNLGIGGNCVLQGGLGEPAVDRFDRDILGQRGVTTLVVFEGVNDIGGSKSVEKTSRQLIRAYQKFIAKAHERGIRVWLGTITPIGNSGYWSYFHEACRQTVNEWIRSAASGGSAAEAPAADGVIDFDQLVRDPRKPAQMRPDWQFDWLHPNAEGYKNMGMEAAEKLRKH